MSKVQKSPKESKATSPVVKIKREKFLNKLDRLRPGISVKGIIQQSNCFIFDKNRIVTYNEEVACQIPGKIGGFSGAFQADPLLKILGKLPDEFLELELKKEKL